MTSAELAVMLSQVGGCLYLVGGGVRDKLLGLPTKDLDYCVTGISSSQFQALCKAAICVGRSFPVFRLELDGAMAEVAMARKDHKIGRGHRGFEVQADGLTTIEEDLERRDLTVNAMAIEVLSGRLIDPFSGRVDLQDGMIRAVSGVFAEDPLRVYRAARFASQLSFRIDDSTLALMTALRGELSALSVERVFQELRKALESRQPSLFFRVLDEANVLDVHFPEIASLIGVEQPILYHPEGDAFEHSLQALDAASGLTNRPELRFAALVHDVGKGVTPRSKWPHHHGHEALGVPLVISLCKRLRMPKSWQNAAATGAAKHEFVRFFDKLRPLKVVELLETVHRSSLGVSGLSILGLADMRGRNSMDAVSQNADDVVEVWEFLRRHAGGRQLTTTLTGPAFGEALRVERAKYVQVWRNRHMPLELDNNSTM